MPSLGNLWYTLGVKDMTEADITKINSRLKSQGFDIKLTPRILKDLTQSAVPRGIKIELDPKITNEALARVVEGKVIKVVVTPLLTGFRDAMLRATRENPVQVEVGISGDRLRALVERVLNRYGFMININTVNDNFTQTIQQKLNGKTYTVKIHADANEITRSVQASLIQLQSRHFGLQVSKDVLRNSIEQALTGRPFNIQIAVMQDQARRAVQHALNNARMVGKDEALAYQRLQTGELRAAQAELARLKAAHAGAAEAAKIHTTASVNLGGAMGSNINIAGELGSSMASLYSIHAAKQFLSQVIEIGGELEHQKIAMDTIFGDKGKTNELFGRIKNLARNSPFGVMELTKSVKALSAYGVEYNEIYDTAKRLADISAATSVDINRLILAFGKTKSRGFLDGLEAKQFAYANIPIYELVRKKLEELEGQAVTTADVMARMKKREISFDMVKSVLWDVTDEGGKFYNMQEALAGSVKTSWKLVRDNIELMFGEIAEGAVGSSLKSIAEVLQGLTRNWRTVAAVVSTAAAGLGMYKVATIGVNSAIQKGTIATYNSIIAQKQKSAEDLKAWGRITQLTRAELTRIATANRLTNEDLRQAIAAEKLNEKHIAQLFWQKKITAEQIRYLTSIGMLNPAMSKAILSNNKFTLSLQMMKGALQSVGRAVGAFLLSPWTIGIAALSGLAAIFQNMSEQGRMAEEFGKALSTKASDGAKNLTAALRELNGEFANMSDLQLSTAVDKLEQVIKDYGLFADKLLFYSRVDDNGIERTLQQRAEYLYQQAKILEAAYTKFRDWKLGDAAARASESTNGNFWSTKWTEGLQSDINDYVKDVRNAQKELTNYLREHEDEARLVVSFAAEIDPSFANLTSGMGIEQAMNALMSDLNRLQQVYDAFPRASNGRLVKAGHDFYEFAGLSNQFLNNFTNTDVKHSMEEVLREQDTFMASLKKEILAKDAHFFDNLTDEKRVMLGMAFQEAFSGMDGLDYQYVLPFVERWNNYMGTAFDPSFIEGQIQGQFKSLIPELGAELAKKVKNGEQLEQAEQEKVKDLFDRVVQTVKNTWPGRAAEIQSIVDSRPVYANVLLSVNTRANMDNWRKEVDDAFGNNAEIAAKIKGEADTQSTLKAIGELKKSAKKALDKFAVSFNITPDFKNLTKLSTEGPLTAFEKQQREEYNKLVDVWNNILKGENTLGISLDEETKNKDKGTEKDTVAENLKQRFKDIKDAWNEFQKWSKTEGRVSAAKRIGDSGLFSTLSVEQIPQTEEQYRALVEKLEADLRKAGIKGHSQREGLLNDILKQLLDIDKSVVDEQLKLALDKVTKEAEKQLADWNLFDKIRRTTGNQNLAISVAFGLNADATTDYPALVKKQFDAVYKAAQSVNKDLKDATFDSLTPQQVEALPTELQKAWEDATKKLQQYAQQQKEAVADILNEYQSLQDKIDAINAKRKLALETINAKNEQGNYILSPEERDKRSMIVNTQADYDIFTKSNDYLRFFNDIYGLTMDEANRIGDLIQLNLNQKLQAGLITIYDYEKEMEKVRKQLESLRNVKSDAMTFLTGGVKGLNQKKLQKEEGRLANDDGYNKALKDQIAAQNALDKAKESGNKEAIKAAQAQLEAANASVKTYTALRDKIIKNQADWQNALDVANIAANIAGGISDAFYAISDIAASFGVDTDSGVWLDIGAAVDTLTAVTGGVSQILGSLMQGDIGGAVGGVFKTIATPFTIWGELHDKKLNKLIERSKEAAQIMQNQYDILEKQMANFLGNAANMNTGVLGGGYGKQRQLMQGQLAELEKQRQAEIDKKKTDNSVVEDYNKQIEEMKISIRDFAIEAANTIYGIDLNGWAQQLGDALMDAFAKGEDAAEAFDKTVGDIMRDVASKMISQDILAPMFGDLRNYLFGENGMSGAFGADFQLSPDEAAKMKEYMDRIKNQGIPAAQELYDAINEATGGILDDASAKSGPSAGIQSVTEDTADLLASYINSIRADVSLQVREYLPKLLEAMPLMNTIAQSQLDTQRQIAENTLRNAVAAEEIARSNDDISRLLNRVTQGVAKFNIQ